MVADGSGRRDWVVPGAYEAEGSGAEEGREVEAGTEGDEEAEADVGEPESEVGLAGRTPPGGKGPMLELSLSAIARIPRMLVEMKAFSVWRMVL